MRGAAAWIAVIVGTVLTGCGGSGGGGGGGSSAPGPTDFAIPIGLGEDLAARVLSLENLSNEPTTATIQAYKQDGTAYTGPFVVDLVETGQLHLSLDEVIGGATPAGGWIHVRNPSRDLEIAFSVTPAGLEDDCACRATPLPDLLAPLVPMETGANVTPQTLVFQITNVTGLANTVTVTPFETAVDPTDPPIEGTDVVVALLPYETKKFLPGELTDLPFSYGSLRLSAPLPFFVMGAEDFALDPPRTAKQFEIRTAGLTFGRVPTAVPEFHDFVMIARNDTDDSQLITLTRLDDPDGVTLAIMPRTVEIPARASRIFTTVDPPFDDVFGDVLLSPFIRLFRIELQVAEGVDVAFRQFEPELLAYTATIRPTKPGFVLLALGVTPNPLTTETLRTFATILNTTPGPITVRVDALIPQPDDVPPGIVTLGDVVVPGHGRVNVSPDGIEFRDRDLMLVPRLTLRFTSNAAFGVTGIEERRTAGGFLFAAAPMIIRPLDSAD